MCERTRGWASLALDNELSEFEQTLLTEHVEHCSDCAAFVEDLRQLTAELRAAGPVPLARPVSLPERRRVAFRGGQVAAAAAVVAAAIGLGTMVSASQPPVVRDTDAVVGVTGNQFVALSDMEAETLVRASRRRGLAPPVEYSPSQKFLVIPI